MSNSQEIVNRILGKKEVNLLGKGATKGKKPQVVKEFEDVDYDDLNEESNMHRGLMRHRKGKGCR
jgi:hypothetical protein